MVSTTIIQFPTILFQIRINITKNGIDMYSTTEEGKGVRRQAMGSSESACKQEAGEKSFQALSAFQCWCHGTFSEYSR